MIVKDEPSTETDAPDNVAVPQLESRFSIVRDAIANDKAHAEEALKQFLQTAGRSLGTFRIDSAGEAPLDVRILAELAAMKPCRDYFLELVHLACSSRDARGAHEHFRAFLGQTIALKKAPRDIIHFNHLWCDHFRFFVRELFLGTIGLLIRHEQFDEVAAYLKATYSYPSQSGPRACNFLSFDAYIKSLDEFRARRLRQAHQPIATDVLRERADLQFLAFDDLMQADFLLCVYGLLHHPDTLIRWCPRTLVYAGDDKENGFDFFVKAAAEKRFTAVATVLNVRSRHDLRERFEDIRHRCRLDLWKIGERPIAFERYMGLAGSTV